MRRSDDLPAVAFAGVLRSDEVGGPSSLRDNLIPPSLLGLSVGVSNQSLELIGDGREEEAAEEELGGLDELRAELGEDRSAKVLRVDVWGEDLEVLGGREEREGNVEVDGRVESGRLERGGVLRREVEISF